LLGIYSYINKVKVSVSTNGESYAGLNASEDGDIEMCMIITTTTTTIIIIIIILLLLLLLLL